MIAQQINWLGVAEPSIVSKQVLAIPITQMLRINRTQWLQNIRNQFFATCVVLWFTPAANARGERKMMTIQMMYLSAASRTNAIRLNPIITIRTVPIISTARSFVSSTIGAAMEANIALSGLMLKTPPAKAVEIGEITWLKIIFSRLLP